MLSLILSVLVGSGIGATLGYFGQCSSGTCPLTSTWWRGALYGAGMGLLFGVTSLRSGSPSVNQSTKNVKLIGQSEFEAEVTKAETPVLVDFYAPWCGPCKTLAPVLDDLAGQFTNQVKFVKVNVDKAAELARRYDITSVPTLLFLKNGKIVDNVSGLISADALRARLRSFAGAHAAVSSAK